MEAIATHTVNAAHRFIPPWVLRAMTPSRKEQLKRLFSAALEGMNAATPDVAPEFYRFPFP
jgi:hypothetical protein